MNHIAFYNREAPGAPRHLNFSVGLHPDKGILVVPLTTVRQGWVGPVFTQYNWVKIHHPSRVAHEFLRVITWEQWALLCQLRLVQHTELPPPQMRERVRDLLLTSESVKQDLKALLRDCYS